MAESDIEEDQRAGVSFIAGPGEESGEILGAYLYKESGGNIMRNAKVGPSRSQ